MTCEIHNNNREVNEAEKAKVADLMARVEGPQVLILVPSVELLRDRDDLLQESLFPCLERHVLLRRHLEADCAREGVGGEGARSRVAEETDHH